jgi:O-acetyl-ADP-ribose deacetylase (regulator of RNase III)
MIKHVIGNILDSSADALVNTVNTVGVMGKGIALQFRQAFPDNYDAYVRACEPGRSSRATCSITKSSLRTWYGHG